MTGQLDLSTKNINAAAKIESTKKQASDYIDKGTQNVNIARDMPVANRAFGSIYPHNNVPYEKLVNSFDRAGNKLYNELKNSAESALFAQETRSDLANAVSDATNSLLFKEQLKIIESNLGENSQSFINGMCEDILLELADDLASGGKASAKSIERKILGSFSDAVSISQEYKSSTSLVQDSSKTNTGDLFGENKGSKTGYSLPKNIEIVDGSLGGKIPIENYQGIRQFSIKNPNAESIMLGTYSNDANSYIAKAGNASSYFDMGNDIWEETRHNFNLSGIEMFEYFNKPFLDDAIENNKKILFSHNPTKFADSFLFREWKYIKEQLKLTDDNLYKEGEFWNVR